MGWLGAVFPRWSANRAQSRLKQAQAEAALSVLTRRFEGAAGGRRNQGWRATGADANSELAPALGRLRNRSRDLRRNTPYAERGISAIADNVVGYGITPRAKGANARVQKKLKAHWQAWAETLACDADGLENFYGLQHKIVETVVESGECLIRRRYRKSSDGLPLPIQLQVLEPDYLDESKTGLLSNSQNRIIQGIEFDAIGRRVAYWLFSEHPGDNSSLHGLTSQRVPAEDVIHVFLPKRPGQARGYTWLAPVMQRLRQLDEMDDAIIEQAKIAACFAGFVSKDETSPGAKRSEPLLDRIEPGVLQELGIGESVTFGTPPTFNGYQAYSWQGLHAVSVGLGVPYELLTGDLKGVNFSSGRMGWLHFARRVDVWQWRMLIPQFCDRAWGWFMEAQMLMGGTPEPLLAEWTPPRRDMVDPKTEVATVKERMRLGLLTPDDAMREAGITDPDEYLERFKTFFEQADKLGLVFDFDARRISGAGQAQNTTQPQDSGDATTDNNPNP